MVDTPEVSVLLALTTTLRLTFMVVVPSNIGEEIHGPSEKLLENKIGSGQDGGFLHQLRQFMGSLANPRRILLPGLGHEHHVTGEVSGSLVVLSMRDLPGEVRNQQERMANKSDSVVEDL